LKERMIMMNSHMVVGVDGSPGSISALRWAIDEAEVRGIPLDVVLVIPYRAPEGEPWPLNLTPEYTPQRLEEARQEAALQLEGLLKEHGTDHVTVEIRPHVVAGQPARRLMRLAEGADLLVVGSRGLGGFRGLVLGSVSTQCVHHAPCPVVVVPQDEDDEQSS
jgi:nucleotide-binding universal stress UspA family protein